MLSFVHVLLVSSVLHIPFVCSETFMERLRGIIGGHGQEAGPDIPTSKPGSTTPADLSKVVEMSVSSKFYKDQCATHFKFMSLPERKLVLASTLSEQDYECVEIPPSTFVSFDLNNFRVSTCFSLIAVMHHCAGLQLFTQRVVNAYVSGDEEQARTTLFKMFNSMKEEERKYSFAVIHFMGSVYDLCEKSFCEQLKGLMKYFDGVAGPKDDTVFPKAGSAGFLYRRTYTHTQDSEETLKWVVANHDMVLATLNSKTFASRLHDEFSYWFYIFLNLDHQVLTNEKLMLMLERCISLF
ncbi:hypothetical protein RF11_10843 [Thelohanellus kitauei]|uniref:Uncharacterized protein n=1 Tax=Thelohanellus kitauei TaxID=669202 RepID=A0A0C2MB63_THEKT|nr:hypothetical protein RF11_10843 [Thelohanellus kitauei]